VSRVLKETGHGRRSDAERLRLALEKIALSDEYFIERKLYPNVDFYSGITLKAMGFPTSMFTVLFAVARTVGWISQWSEMIEDPHQKIGLPRQLYTGVPVATTSTWTSASNSLPQATHESRMRSSRPASLFQARRVFRIGPERYRRHERWAADCRSTG